MMKEHELSYQELERRLTAIVQTIPHPMSFVSRDYRYLAVNDAYASFYEAPIEDIVGRKVADFFGEPVFEETIRPHLDRCLAGETVRYESQFRFPDDSVRWMAMEYHPYRDEKGRVVGVISHGLDITEQRDVEEKLKKTLDAATDGIWYWHFPSNQLTFGARYYTMLGYEPDEFPPTFDNWLDLIHPDDRDAALSVAEKYLQTKPDLYQNDFRLRMKNGEYRWIQSRARVVERSPEGEAILMIGNHEDITERKKAEKALRASEERFRSITEQTSDMIALTDNAGLITYVSPSCKEVFRAESKEMMGRHFTEFLDESAVSMATAAFQESIAKGVRSRNLELLMKRKDGSLFCGELNGSRYSSEAASGTLVLIRDISERKQAQEERERLQAQLLQAQKMESVGRLAGGVAHDFNNVLQSIIGHVDLALMDTDRDHPIYADLQEIRGATRRSTNIIRQLLAFARKQAIVPEVLDLNDVVAGMLKMLRRLIGEDINLAWLPGDDVWKVRMDPSQIDQILVNLVINARDAIQDVGQVSIETANAALDEAYCAAHPESVPGPYVRISVSDTGCGMDRETLQNIFDPFFTTKELGKGTGLGLATLYGIVKQNNGYIEVHSEPGKGAAFHIYLPRHEVEPEEGEEATATSAGPAVGTETVLLVEDQPSVLDMATRMLTHLGYTVLKAAAPKEAIRLAGEYAGEIHLLMTDVVMPGMNGRDLADRIRQTRPAIRSLYMSGYTADIIARQGVLEKSIQFIQKPFSLDQLAQKVREAIGQ